MNNHFYVSIIFLGIILIVIAFIWIIYDRKKYYDNTKRLDKKREELVNIISDAEQMVEELNKFSDYIVTRMDIKNEELCTSLKALEERASKVSSENIEKQGTKVYHSENVVNGILNDVQSESSPILDLKSDLIMDNIDYNNDFIYEPNVKQQVKVNEKVIPINSKYKEVVQLANRGLSDTEIAKQLNLGKGEIQLILGINR